MKFYNTGYEVEKNWPETRLNKEKLIKICDKNKI